MQPGLTRRLAAFAAEADASRFPESARTSAKLSLLDWCAVGRAGVDEPVSRIVREMVEAEGGTAEASLFGSATKLPARAAALANGATSHALDYDDTHFDYVGHPSVAIFPAALAMAERVDASGRAFLDAALIGLETAVRIGRWLGTAHYQHGFHQTSTAGSFGAAAACARLLGLDAERAAHSLGIAATRASGLKSQFGTMGKPYHAGMAASNGVEAATLAARGFVSRADGIECEQGFGATHAGEGGPIDPVLEGLGRTFRFERVQYKLHACCHGTHAAIEALLALRERDGVAAGDIDSIALVVNPRWLRVCDIARPRTGLEAKFSYRLTSAMVFGELDTSALASFSEATCARADLVALSERVRVEADAALPDTAAHVRLRTKRGMSLERMHDLDAPVSAEVQQAKLLAKAKALLGEAEAESERRAIDGLGTRAARALAPSLLG
jgi:2-methylcitrate dehydratase PrpD